MKDSIRRDNLFSIIGTAVAVGFFVLVVYLPSEQACQAARRSGQSPLVTRSMR